jgi:hypothetical protein
MHKKTIKAIDCFYASYNEFARQGEVSMANARSQATHVCGQVCAQKMEQHTAHVPLLNAQTQD